MNREELILSCVETVDNLVKKYNNHVIDEDLKTVGVIATIECVDRCIADGMSDVNQIKARCNVWAKNRILDEIYKEKLKYSDDAFVLDELEAPEDMRLLIAEVSSELTPKQKQVFDLLLEGKSFDEIAQIMGVKIKVIYKHCAVIKEKIKN